MRDYGRFHLRTYSKPPHDILIIDAAAHNVQIALSPSGRSVRVWVNGEEWKK